MDGFLALLEYNSWLLYLGAGLLGLTVGSFLNVVIHRLPLMMEKEWRSQCRTFLKLEEPGQSEEKPVNLVSPRSRCPHCNHAITALENIPVLSYLFLKGRCRSCRKPISMRYPLVETLSAILCIMAAWRFGVSSQTGFAMLLAWALIALTFIDIDHQLLPDEIVLPTLWLGLLISTFGAGFTELDSAVIGAAAGYLSLWLVYHGFKLATGKEGMGYGDFKLLALLGAWMGWTMLPMIILLSSLAGAVIGGINITLSRMGRHQQMPFGPYLCIAGWIALIWGDAILQSYLQFANLNTF